MDLDEPRPTHSNEVAARKSGVGISEEARARAREAWEKHRALPNKTMHQPASSPLPSLSKKEQDSDAVQLTVQLENAARHGVNGKLLLMSAAREAAASISGHPTARDPGEGENPSPVQRM